MADRASRCPSPPTAVQAAPPDIPQNTVAIDLNHGQPSSSTRSCRRPGPAPGAAHSSPDTRSCRRWIHYYGAGSEVEVIHPLHLHCILVRFDCGGNSGKAYCAFVN
ncbi:hypothetical protein EJB05_27666, partial [Eragrostis curvula]